MLQRSKIVLRVFTSMMLKKNDDEDKQTTTRKLMLKASGKYEKCI